MKKTILLAMVLFSYAICFSQSFNYQAVVRDASNNPIANQAIGVELKILDGSATGSTLYTETHTVTSNINGVIAISVGEGTTMDVFSTIDWSTQNQWLDLSVDITGGTTYSNLGTTKLLQVPYALYATEAGNLTTPYTAGSGIAVTNNVISATNEGWLRTNGTLPTSIGQSIYRTGNIGIGASASSPSFPLDVIGTGGERVRVYTQDGIFAGYVAKNSTREFFMGVQADYETTDASSGFHIYDNTAGAQRMVIDKDGNVGINQANPNQKLQVNGSIRMVDGNQQNGYVMVTDASGTGSWQSPDILDNQTADVFQLNVNALELSLENDGAATQTVDLSGYLDNTDAQTADVFQLNVNALELSLENDGAATQTVDLSGYLDNTDAQTADVFQLNVNALELSLENDGAATQTVDLSGYLDNTDVQKADVFQLTDNTLELSLENDGEDTKTIDLGAYLDADNLGDHTATQALNLNSNTILGVTNVTTGTIFSTAANATINTTTPNGAEGIIMAGSTSDYTVSVQDGNGRVQHKWNASYGTSETYIKGNEDAAFIDINGDAATDNDAWIEFKHANGASAVAGDAISWNTQMIINQGGQVGINETSPDDQLHVTAAGNGTRIRLENSGNGWAGMVAKNTQREFFIGVQGAFDANPGELHIFDNTAGARRMVIDANGEVGIGRNNPSVKLDVNGSVNCTGGTCSSDQRWKRNITTLDNTLANISKLRGVSYFWRTQEFPDRDFESDKQIGVIAQEVEKIYPELIHTDNDGYKSMDYMSLSAVLLEATKQQQVLIEQQQKELDMLKQKLDKVDALEAKLDKLLSE